MKKIIPVIVAALIGAAIGHLATPHIIDAHKALLEKAQKVLDHKLDSVNIVEMVRKERDSVWTAIHRSYQDSIRQMRIVSDKAVVSAKLWQQKYEKNINNPVTRFNEHQLDSAISALLQARKRR